MKFKLEKGWLESTKSYTNEIFSPRANCVCTHLSASALAHRAFVCMLLDTCGMTPPRLQSSGEAGSSRARRSFCDLRHDSKRMTAFEHAPPANRYKVRPSIREHMREPSQRA